MKIRSFHVYVMIIIVSLLVITTSAYYLLGGFEEVVVYELEGNSRIVVGKHFVGKQTDRTVNDYFTESRDLILDSAIIGTLTIVVYQNDSLKGREVDYFIGVSIEGDMAEVPAGYGVLEFESSKRLAVFLSMSPFVRPSPRKVNKLFQDKAAELGLELAPYVFELHYYDDSMSIEAWID